ncbi:MAG: hypothetical protein E6J34_06045 [Chloroflexi bacterium]|nr:MAG: hypothetical protein E6J34_06045 [Chloroflexota bacterium]
MVLGLIGAGLGISQVIVVSASKPPIPVVGPIAGLFNPPYGMDIGFELGVVIAAIAYLILRRVELNTSKR